MHDLHVHTETHKCIDNITCTCVHMHTRTHARTHTRPPARTHTRTHTHTHTQLHYSKQLFSSKDVHPQTGKPVSCMDENCRCHVLSPHGSHWKCQPYRILPYNAFHLLNILVTLSSKVPLTACNISVLYS